MISNVLSKLWKKTQRRKYQKSDVKIGASTMDVSYKLLERRIGVVKSMTKQHVHDDGCQTRRGQLSHVKRTTLFLMQFVDHLFHFHQDPRLHHTLTESEPLQDRQTQLVIVPKCRVIMSKYDSWKQQQCFTNSTRQPYICSKTYSSTVWLTH